jgi:type I restriction enzyme S subunit
MSGWQSVRLGDVAEINPVFSGKIDGDFPVSFVPMAAVDADTAAVTGAEQRRYSQVSKGYTPFLSGDILVAKITPCFENGKIAQATIPQQHGFGSTEFHVVRPIDGKSDRRYLLHFLRQQRIRIEGERKMTGSAGQRRVPEYFITGLNIPLPSLDEQRRIAAILDQADALRAQRRAALALLDTLTQSIFLDMFGDPATNPKGWKTYQLGDISEFYAGASLPIGIEFRGQQDGLFLLKVSDMNLPGNDLYITRCQSWSPVAGSRASTCPPGSILIPKRGGAIGTNKKRLTTRDSILDPNLMAIWPRPGFIDTMYLFQWFQKLDLASITSGSSVPQLNKRDLAPLEVPTPPLKHQEEFSARFTAVEELRLIHYTALSRFDALFASLQYRAFRGEL